MSDSPAPLHADDDTPCTEPELCSHFGLVYWPGGREPAS